jgi:hypothetical protein
LQDCELRAERGQEPAIAALDRFARRPARGNLAEHFRQRHQVRHRASARRRRGLAFAAVGERLDSM